MRIRKNPDGSLYVDAGRLRRFEVSNALDLLYFKRTNEHERTTLELNFINDGSYSIVYSKTGKILKFKGVHVLTSFSADGVVTLAAKSKRRPSDSAELGTA